MCRSYYLHLVTRLELKDHSVDDVAPEELNPEECVTEIEGQIMCWEEDSREPVEVGRVQALLIDLHRTANEWETLDSRSSELEGLYPHVFSRYAGVMRPEVARIYDEDGGSDMLWDPVLYVEKVEVNVSHRGRGVGLMAMDALLTHFRPHATLAFCKPSPLHRRPSRGSPEVPDPRYFDPRLAKRPIRAAVAALGRYWARAGFRRLRRGPYYILNLKSRTVIRRSPES